MYYVYIIYSKSTKKIYKGSTSDLNNRLYKHNSKCVVATKKGTPWNIIFYECFNNKEDAIKEELFLKTGQGRKRISYLLKKTLENL